MFNVTMVAVERVYGVDDKPVFLDVRPRNPYPVSTIKRNWARINRQLIWRKCIERILFRNKRRREIEDKRKRGKEHTTTLTDSMLELLDDTTLEHEYEENQHATEYVVDIEDCFDGGAVRVLGDDFQDPRNAHHSE